MNAKNKNTGDAKFELLWEWMRANPDDYTVLELYESVAVKRMCFETYIAGCLWNVGYGPRPGGWFTRRVGRFYSWLLSRRAGRVRLVRGAKRGHSRASKLNGRDR